MSGPIFSLQNLTLAGSFGPRLDSLTLLISAGSTAIVGLSGAGKTSLLHVLAGFEVTFSGELTSRLPSPVAAPEHRLPLFWVPQSGGLWPHLSTAQHLQIVDGRSGRNSESGLVSGRISERSDEILSCFDLTHRRNAFPAELSLGERSRLALARALAARAHVLLLDEPLSHVDPVRKPDYWQVVRQFVEAENISMVFTSHEPETVLRQATQVVCLDTGRVAFQGSVNQLYHNPPDARLGAFLGPLNWFQADEADLFFAERAPGHADFALRPERLCLVAAEDSAVELVSQPNCGARSESIVRHVATGTTRVVRHQSSAIRLATGQRVALLTTENSEQPCD